MAIRKYLPVVVVDTLTDLPATADTGQIAYCIDTKLPVTFNGTSWAQSNRVSIKKSTVAIDGKTAGATKIYTLEQTASNFTPTMIILRNINISGVTTRPTVSFGSNVGVYDNIASASLLGTALATVGADSGVPQMAAIAPPMAPGAEIFANVTIQGVATNYQFRADIIGYYD